MKLFILTLLFITIFFKTTFSFDLENLSEVTEDLEKAQKELKNVLKVITLYHKQLITQF